MGLRGLLDESLCQMCINVIVPLTEVKSQHKAVGHQWRSQQEIPELSHKTKKNQNPTEHELVWCRLKRDIRLPFNLNILWESDKETNFSLQSSLFQIKFKFS